MASNTLNVNFDWGDIVEIKLTAPIRYNPGALGCICGIRIIDSEEIAIEYNQEIGSELYLIEFNDGKSIEVPKVFLTSPDGKI